MKMKCWQAICTYLDQFKNQREAEYKIIPVTYTSCPGKEVATFIRLWFSTGLTKISVHVHGLSRATLISAGGGSAPQSPSGQAGPNPFFSPAGSSPCCHPSLSPCIPHCGRIEPGPDWKSTLMINRFWSEGISTPTGCQPASCFQAAEWNPRQTFSHLNTLRGFKLE